MQVLLTKLSDNKVTWWTKKFSLYSIIVYIASKEYLIYYLDIIHAIYFLISYWLFVLYMKYAAVRYYSIDNSNDKNIVNNEN